MPKRVLVTGAAGFVGAVLARRLLRDGHEVHLLVRPDSDPWRLEGMSAPRHLLDLSVDRLDTMLRAVRPEWIFHLAAHGGGSTHTDCRRMIQANIVGTFNLIEAALQVGSEAFVNAGSSSEYGFTDHPAREDDCPQPNSHYAVTKLSQTQLCSLTARRYDVHMPTLRLYSVYGPYEGPTRLVPTLIARGLEGQLPPLVSPDVARDFVYADDVVEAFVLAARHSGVPRGAVYNVGTGCQTTMREAVSVARDTFDIATQPEWQSMPDRTWDTTTWVASTESIERDLGWKALVPFNEGFRRFAAWSRRRR